MNKSINITLQEVTELALSIIHHAEGRTTSWPELFIYNQGVYFNPNSPTYGSHSLIFSEEKDLCKRISIQSLVEESLLDAQLVSLSQLKDSEEAEFRFYALLLTTSLLYWTVTKFL